MSLRSSARQDSIDSAESWRSFPQRRHHRKKKTRRFLSKIRWVVQLNQISVRLGPSFRCRGRTLILKQTEKRVSPHFPTTKILNRAQARSKTSDSPAKKPYQENFSIFIEKNIFSLKTPFFQEKIFQGLCRASGLLKSRILCASGH